MRVEYLIATKDGEWHVEAYDVPEDVEPHREALTCYAEDVLHPNRSEVALFAVYRVPEWGRIIEEQLKRSIPPDGYENDLGLYKESSYNESGDGLDDG